MKDPETLTDDEVRDLVRWAEATPGDSYYADAAKCAAVRLAEKHSAKLIALMLSRGALADGQDPVKALGVLLSERRWR